jgi:hypothetical protein
LLSGATYYAEKLPALVGKLSATDVSATCEFLAYATGLSRLTGEMKESESCGYAIPLQICLDVDVLIFAVMHKIGIGEIAAPQMPSEFEEVLYFLGPAATIRAGAQRLPLEFVFAPFAKTLTKFQINSS